MIINAAGGGAKELAIKIVGGTVQPAGVAGMLWVETGAAIAAWTLDSLAPAAPANGDVWVELSDRIAATINVLRHNAIIARVKRVWQYSGAEWVRKNAYHYDGGTWTQTAKANTIYGARWTYSASSPLLTRLEDAAGLTATASVGATAGASDFDDLPIYGDIRLCNLADNGTVNAYDGDPTFTRDGSNGQVMVEFPQFWVKVVDDTANSQLSFYITDGPLDGYVRNPLFAHNGYEQSRVYVAAYKTGTGNVSKTGLAPLLGQTRATARAGIVSARGNNWSMTDIAARSAIDILIMIEYATLNIQAAIGSGITGGSSAHVCGESDSVAGGTGRASGTDNVCAVVWRGLENLWGNTWEWLDGININGGIVYYALTQTNFADDTTTNYTALGVTVSTALSASYATKLHPNAITIPTTFTGGSSTTYLCDASWSSTGWRVFAVGGRWDSGLIAGLFCLGLDQASTSTGTSATGTRMMYVPTA